MTTLADGRRELLATFDSLPDSAFKKKMMAQVLAITTGSNPYFVWISLSADQQRQYGSVEHHPQGTELCLERWINTKAAEVWSETNPSS